MPEPATVEYKPIEILELQMLARMLETEALGRYVTDPGNLDGLREAFREAFRIMRKLRKTGAAPDAVCPKGWTHRRDCSCTPRDADGDDDD
jgi:hypothetical protein